MRGRVILALLALLGTAEAGDLDFGYIPNPGPGEDPALLVTPKRAMAEIYVQIEAGGETYTFEKSGLAAGRQERFSWPRDAGVTTAEAFVRGVFPDGYVEEFTLPISYSYSSPLSVDLSRAQADVAAHTLTVSVTSPVDSADIVAYGAGKAVLDRQTVPVRGGPGDITLPWAGDPSEVVLLDVTVRSGGAWAGFTFSPWYLDIPHDDVHFETDKADIPPGEAWKLEATLKQLHDVVDKYGDLVPVKVFIAGCTDTAGDTAHNRDLSLRRARSIAAWLRQHGYDKPLYYHGFGEAFLAVQTGDGVDEARNRRALYIVAANPPPPGSGVPQVDWREL